MSLLLILIFFIGAKNIDSLTLNMEDKLPQNMPTLLIFRKSKPSILVFSPNQKIVLKYPRSNRHIKIALDKQPSVQFQRIDDQKAQAVLKNVQVASKNPQVVSKDGQVVTKDSTQAVLKQKQSQKQKGKSQQHKEIANQPKTKNVTQPQALVKQQKKPLPAANALTGNYTIQKFHTHFVSAKQLSFNNTHISYTICSKNTCQYRTENKTRIEFGTCTLKSQPQCVAFSDKFYQDLQFLTNLQLSETFEEDGGTFKFYDRDELLRLQIEKSE